MEELSGGIVQIVLNLNEGRGFEGIKQPFYVSANLNGHKLDSDFINPASNPYFGTDLVWEAEKKTVKRLRTINTIIKLEFFSGVNSSQQERIGFILVHLKAGQIISKKSSCKLIESWHKILGLKTRSKVSRPEVLLSLRIEEISDAEITGVPKNLNAEPARKTTSKPDVKNVPKPLQDEIHGASEKPYVQIGPLHLTPEMFHFTVIIGPTQNLSKSLSEMVISSTSNCIHFAYSMFGEYVSSSPISDDSYLSKSSHFVKSSYPFLNAYFQQNSFLHLSLYHGTNKIGSTGISLQPFLLNDVEFHYELESKNFFRIHETCSIFFEHDAANHPESDLQPSVGVTITVTKIDPKFETCIISKSTCFDSLKPVEEAVKPPEKLNNTKVDSLGSRTKYEKTTEETAAEHAETVNQPKESKKPSFMQTMPEKFGTNFILNNNEGSASLPSPKSLATAQGRLPAHCSLVVSIDSIIFKLLPKEGNFSFKFYHPRATDITISGFSEEAKEINRIIHFPQPLTAKLNFNVSSVDIQQLHQNPLEIYIDHSSGTFALAQFFLPAVTNKEYTCVGIAEANYKMESCGCSQPVAYIYATLTLASDNPPSQTNERGLSILANKELIYRVVEELEDWKEKQEIMFKYKLKEKEDTHLKNLSEEWERQRKELEKKLLGELKSCEELRSKLISMIDVFHERYHRLAQKEAQVAEQVAEEERKRQIQKQYLAEATKKIEETMHAHKILSEKLTAATQSKLFFKEQWARAVRELRRLRPESEECSLQRKSSGTASCKRFEADELACSDALLKKFNLRPEAFNSDEFDIQNVEYDPALFSDPHSLESVKEKDSTRKSTLLRAEREASIQKLNNFIREHLKHPL